MNPEIEIALFCIDPGLPVEDWLAIGSALKAEGEPFELYDRWSKPAPNYQGTKQCRAQWNGFKVGHYTKSTIFKFAYQYGYTGNSSNYSNVDYTAIEKRKADAAKRAAAQEKQDKAKKEKVAMSCAAVFNAAPYAPQTHPYLARKNARSHGLKVDSDGNLMIPMFNHQYQIQSIQTISASGEKKFTYGSNGANGAFFQIGEITGDCDIYVTGGYVTGDTINKLTNCPVFVAFADNNLESTALFVMSIAQGRTIIIAADNDWFYPKDLTKERPKHKNSGVVYAIKAAKASGALLSIPYGQGTDFNDLYTENPELATNQIFNWIEPATIEGEYLEKQKIEEKQPEKQNTETFNPVLDSDDAHCTVDFLKFIPNDNLLKRLVIDVSNKTWIPPHTVFLMAAGVISGMFARKYSIKYEYGDKPLPIGLYVISEHPPGSAKTWSMSEFSSVFLDVYTRMDRDIEKKRSEFEKNKDDLTPDEMIEFQGLPPKKGKPILFITNGTAEGIETSLNSTKGFFSLISTEKGLLNALLGTTYGDSKSNNNDLMLYGFNGDNVSGVRVTRECYSGRVVGSITLFAQEGSVESILTNTNGDGEADRFLFLVEQDNLGRRDHERKFTEDTDAWSEYKMMAEKLVESIFLNPQYLEDLTVLKLCPEGYAAINKFRNQIEPHLDKGQRFSHGSLRGAASKLNIQIMKLAALFHIFSKNRHNDVISLDCVIMSINIAYSLLEANRAICISKGLFGQKAEWLAIIKMFEKDNRPKLERQILDSRKCVKPFKDIAGSKYPPIKKALAEMVEAGVLTLTQHEGKNMYSLAK